MDTFIKAAQDTLGEMFSLEATAGPAQEMDHLANHQWEVSGIIGITGSGKGMLVLRFRQDIILQFLEAVGMSPSGPDETAEMVNGLVGEIVNVVSGHSINTLPYDLDITVPLIVQGLNHKVNWPKFAPIHSVILSTPMGKMELAVCFSLD